MKNTHHNENQQRISRDRDSFWVFSWDYVCFITGINFANSLLHSFKNLKQKRKVEYTLNNLHHWWGCTCKGKIGQRLLKRACLIKEKVIAFTLRFAFLF